MSMYGSLRHAGTLSGAIADTLVQMDPANADSYRSNAAAYADKLNPLDAQYRAAVDAAPVKTLLFGDRFPFRYLADDYGLDYYAAFAGCSAETEASFQTIIFLANKLDELGLPAVLQIESADGSIARTIVENTKSRNQQVLTLDSITVIMISHDIGAALSYASHILHIGDRVFFGTKAAYLESGISSRRDAGGLHHRCGGYCDVLCLFRCQSDFWRCIHMKKTLSVLLCFVTLLFASACGKSTNEPAVTTETAVPAPGNAVDVDLTQLSSTMVYSEVYAMMTEPENYIGKTVRMHGNFATQEYNGQRLYACIVQDATACCAQGLEFEPESTLSYPDDFPEPGAEITVTGTFDSYKEEVDGNTYIYLVLRNAQMV